MNNTSSEKIEKIEKIDNDDFPVAQISDYIPNSKKDRVAEEITLEEYNKAWEWYHQQPDDIQKIIDILIVTALL